MKDQNEKSIAVVTFLTREQVDYLDKMGKDCFVKYGKKLSRAKILYELIDLLMKLNISLDEIDLKNEKVSEGILRLIINILMDLKIDLDSIDFNKESLWDGVSRLIDQKIKSKPAPESNPI